MATFKYNTDSKGITSSLSAEAAEFVPQCGPLQHANTCVEPAGPLIKGHKSVEVIEVPRYLTSCYPFVSAENITRHQMPRFSQHCQYTGGLPPTLPIPVTPPIRFPTWQSVKPAFVDNFQPSSYGSMSFDMLTSLPIDMYSMRSDGLPIPSKMGVATPQSSGQGMLLATHLDSAPSWILTVPPVFLQQHQQQVHPCQQSQQKVHPHQHQITVTTNIVTTPSSTLLYALSSTTRKQVDKSKLVGNSSKQKKTERTMRPQSPVLISRSTQSDFSSHIHNLTLVEQPHPLYVSHLKISGLSKSGSSHNSNDWRAEHNDSDSGYNSPMHKQNLISCGIQVSPIRTPSESSSKLTEMSQVKLQSCRSQKHLKLCTSPVRNNQADCSECVKPEVGNYLHENTENNRKKNKSRKKEERYSSRSPRLLGSNTKLLSRSSSSLSSSGTRPDEDDEKIDLHSWTDFPPMSSRGAPPLSSSSSSSKPLKSTLTDSERVPLTIERSAHEPPWSIKFSVDDQTRSELSRSPSQEKDKVQTLKCNSSPDSAWGKIGRSFKSSQTSGLDKELSLFMTGPPPVPSGVGTSSKNSSGNVDATMACDGSFKTLTQSNQMNASANRISDNGKGSANCPTSFARVNYVNSSLSNVSSTSPSISVTSQLQSATTTNTSLAPMMHQRPPFPGALSNVNYHIPPPGQPPLLSHPTGSSYLPFTSYANATQELYTKRTTSPQTLPRVPNNQAVYQMISSLENANISFIPSPHTFSSSVPCSHLPGLITYQPTRPPVIEVVPTNTHSMSTDPVLQPPSFTSANSPNGSRTQTYLNICVSSTKTSQSTTTIYSPHCTSLTYKIVDDSNNSTNDTSTKPQINNEQSPTNDVDGVLNSKSVEVSEKRKRRRRKRRGRKEPEEGESDESRVLNHSISNVSESTLHFEDMDEFPDLVSSVHGHTEDINERATLSGTSVTYSDILKSTWSKAGSQSRTQSLTGSCVSGDIDDEDNTSCHTGTTNESKRARKRRKRREQANKAAEAELAEISLEQQWLMEVGLKKSTNHREVGGASGRSTPGLIADSYVVSQAKKQAGGKGGDKKSQQPIAFDIAAMIDAIQKKPTLPASSMIKSAASNTTIKSSKKEHVSTTSTSMRLPCNMLDSSAPLQKRGKEREIGRSKKPSPLKKVILKEREQRKMLRLLDEDPDSATGLGSVGASSGVGIVGGESELSQDALSNKSVETDGEDTNGAAELSADFSPISQTSPISMSPASPGNSGVNSPITGSVGRDPVVMKIHSRRFREYCTQILDKEIDQCCISLLQDLVKFQDRMYHKDPVKAKTKRRVVLGLREVTKHLKLKKIKCVVISPNLEKIQSKGGLDEALNNILNMCRDQDVPFVFALGRRALGRACAKLVPVSVVGIFNYEGCENKYRSLISLTEAARDAYNEMVLAVEKEVAEYPTIASQTSSIGGVPGLFAAHMGHSRTPSGCSAISFTSSILSEPISENFPHAEPEVDSKGYEIVRDAAGNVVHPSGPDVKSKMSSHVKGMANEIDDGNEADTEDFCEIRKKRRGGRPMNSVRFGDVGYVNDSDIKSLDNSTDKNCDIDCVNDDGDERSTLGKLSRNVSELTLTNEDSYMLKQESYSIKHKCSLRNHDDEEEFEDGSGSFDDGKTKTGQEGIYGDPENANYSKWVRVSHIDSIHSQSYSLGNDIFSHHSSQSHDLGLRSQSVIQTRHSQLSPSSVVGAGSGSDGNHAGQKSNFNYEDDDNNNNDDEIDNVDDAEEEIDAVDRHHRVIDKERIKNWLESQSHISTED